MNQTARKKQYVTGPQTRERYGGRSHMWLWRKIKYDPKFPRPVIIAKRIYLDENELDAYDAAAKKAPEARDDR